MQTISQFIQQQFPSFYQSEGPNFIRFIEAYYEFLETSHQYLTLEDPDGFAVDDVITQGSAEGIIVAVDGSQILVLNTNEELFRCKTLCADLTLLVNQDGLESYITLAEQPTPLHLARTLREYRDIDTTIDAFIVGFKEKYLKNIDFSTETNTKLLVKNSLDLYRAKGTERAIDLFFRLVYGTGGSTYVPGRDLFKLSDGQWTRPTYLEITNKRDNVSLVGKQIRGGISNATGFVEKYIRRRVTGDYVCILYLSGITGEFINGEPLIPNGTIITTGAPRVLGSVTSLEVITPSAGFAIGDIVDITSPKGLGGKGRVTAIANSTGAVDFIFIDGGWGYTTNAQSLVSEKVVFLSNVTIANTSVNQYFKYFEDAQQIIANVDFSAATFTGEAVGFANGANVYFANSTGGNIANGVVLFGNNEVSAAVMTGNGDLRVGLWTSNVSTIIADAVDIVLTSNTSANATIDSIADWTITGTVMGVPNTCVLTVNDRTGNFAVDDVVYQSYAGRYADGTVASVIQSGATSYITLSDLQGVFTPGQRISVVANTKTANLQQVDLSVGLYNITGANTGTAFIDDYPSRFITGTVNSAINSVSEGTGAAFSVGSIGETESVYLNTDVLNANNTGYYYANGDFAGVQSFLSLTLDSYGYGFSRNPQGNLTSTIGSMLSFDSFTIGSISTLTGINPGENYNADPYVLARQPYVSAFNRKDYIIEISAPAAFQIGERVLQSNTSLVSYVLDIGNTTGFSVGDAVYQGASYASYDVAGITASVANGTHLIVTQTDGTWGTSVDLKNSLYELNTLVYESLTGAFTVGGAVYAVNSTPAVVGAGIVIVDDAANNMTIGVTEGTISAGNRLYLSSNNANYANVVSLTNAEPNTSAANVSSITITAKGRIKEVDGTTLRVARTQFENYFEAGETLTGQSTGEVGTIVSVVIDEDTLPIGFNAQIEGNVVTSNGTVSSMAVADSGYGYTNGAIVTFTSSDGSRSGTVRTVKSGHGTGTGYFKTTRGFLSSDKYLLDSDYYQEFSYEVISRLPFDRYETMFKEVMHLAGTKLFGAVLLESKNTETATYAESSVTQE